MLNINNLNYYKQINGNYPYYSFSFFSRVKYAERGGLDKTKGKALRGQMCCNKNEEGAADNAATV